MNKQNAKEFLSLVQALADGKTIQFRLNNGANWEDLLDYSISFEYGINQYRIKPKEHKLYTLPLSLRDALEITRDMWKWLSEDISRTKLEWIREFQPQLVNKLQDDCACCVYTWTEGFRDCKRCPLKSLWGDVHVACARPGNQFATWYNFNLASSIRLNAALQISQAAERELEKLDKQETQQCCVAIKEPEPKQPTLRPWKPEEVPVGALLKSSVGEYIIMGRNSCGYKNTDTSMYVEISAQNNIRGGWQIFNTVGSQYSLDHGKTWQPCGVME